MTVTTACPRVFACRWRLSSGAPSTKSFTAIHAIEHRRKAYQADGKQLRGYEREAHSQYDGAPGADHDTSFPLFGCKRADSHGDDYRIVASQYEIDDDDAQENRQQTPKKD